MTLESLFYLLGVIYFIAGLLFLAGILIGTLVAYFRLRQLKNEIKQSTLLVGASKIVNALSSAKALPLLSMAPVFLSGVKLFQQFRRRGGK